MVLLLVKVQYSGFSCLLVELTTLIKSLFCMVLLVQLITLIMVWPVGTAHNFDQVIILYGPIATAYNFLLVELTTLTKPLFLYDPVGRAHNFDHGLARW